MIGPIIRSFLKRDIIFSSCNSTMRVWLWKQPKNQWMLWLFAKKSCMFTSTSGDPSSISDGKAYNPPACSPMYSVGLVENWWKKNRTKQNKINIMCYNILKTYSSVMKICSLLHWVELTALPKSRVRKYAKFGVFLESLNLAFFVVILDSKYFKMTPKFVKQKSHWLHSAIKFANPAKS